MHRMLIVDDEDLIRSSLKKKVEDYGHHVSVTHTAADGVEALAWLDQHYADVCITDVRMPNMNGLDLISHIKRLHPWISCIVVSSYDDFAYVKQSMRLEVIDYVLKPVDTADLHQVIERAVVGLSKVRSDKAARMLLNKLPLYKDMLARWSELVQSQQTERAAQLITDTLDMLEEWAQPDFYLLPHLAVQWMEATYQSLALERPANSWKFPEDMLLGADRLSLDQAQRYFRDSAACYLEREAEQQAAIVESELNRQGTRIVALVKEYIHEHYAQRVTLQEVADAVAMSRTYLASLFKQETGMTFLSYLVHVRMEKARELLLNTSMKVYEITTNVGYENSIHFSKLFKEQYGLTPMEYKKRLGG